MKNTDKYFTSLNKVENQNRLIEQQELRSIVQEKGIFNKLFKGKTMQVLWSVFLASTVGALLYFGVLNNSGIEQDFDNPETIQIIEKKTEKNIVKNEKIEGIKFPENSIAILHLNDDEMEKIGIKRDGMQYIFTTQSQLIAESNIKKAAKHGYPDLSEEALMRRKHVLNINDTEMNDEIMDYDGWDQNKIDFTTPISLLAFKGGRTYSSSFGFVPHTSQDFTDLFYRDEKGKLLKLIREKDIEINSSNYIEFDDSYEVMDNIVLVQIPNNKWNVLLFYTLTDELKSNLPERYKNLNYKNKDFFLNFKSAKKPSITREPEQADIAGIKHLELSDSELEKVGIRVQGGKYKILAKSYYNISKQTLGSFPIDPSKFDIDVSAIKTMEDGLKSFKDVLKKMGYPQSDSGYYYVEMTFTKDKMMEYEVLKNKDHGKLPEIKFYSETHRYFKKNEEYDYWSDVRTTQSDFIGKISNDEKADYKYSDIENRYVNTSAGIIPVSITLGSPNETDTAKINYKHIDIWFDLNEEFVSKLPERYRDPLSIELKYHDLLNKGLMTVDEVCEAIKGESNYLRLCEQQSANININSIYPNPVISGKLSIDLIADNIALKIKLYDSNGKYIGNIYDSNSKIKGNRNINLNLSKIEKGVYILYFESDKNDNLTRKIIVK